MKKLYVLATALFIGASAQAQVLIDFESFTLAPETYDNGSGGNGNFGFSNGEVEFYNDYYVPWSSWTGFAISNTTDVTTPGFLNQYSSWTGSGYDGSSNYAVFYDTGYVSTSATYQSIESFKITNTTYAALSMRDGDGIGKQFGSIYNGDSTVIDGTDGEDFFRVKIYMESHDALQLDSMEVYLADYRFADDTQDYIVDSWMDVDLTASFIIGSVSFKMESSDTTGGWLNTPAYFAIDDVQIDIYGGVNENVLSDVSTFPNPVVNELTIQGEEGQLMITSANGQVMYSGSHSLLSQLDVSNYTSGIYVIQLVNASGSYTNRFIKQ